MSDIEFRVDKAFSSAVEQQLDEQREIRRLVSRVDESLIALSDGMVDLSGQLSAATDRPDRAAVTPEDLEQARQELADHITRVSDRIGDVSRQLSERRDDGEMASTLSATRADLLEAMARLERQSAPVAEAVDESRREVVAALRRISDVVDANRDEAWVEAVGRLDEVIGALRTQTADDRAATQRSVEELRARAEDALASMESAAEGRLADAAERAAARLVEVAEESGDRSATAVQQASIAAERAAAAASEAAERAGEAAADAARSAAAEASTTIEQAAAAAASAAERSSTEARTAVEQAAAAASSAAERAAEESAAAAAAAADRASAAATEAVQAAARAAVEASETASASAEQAVSTAADGMAVLARDLTDRSGETVEEVREIHRVIDLTAKDIAERHADVADRLAEVAQVASALPPELRGTLDDIAGRLTALVEQQRGDAAEAMERIASGRGATPEEVRTLVEDLTASMDRAVSVRFADLVDANADATEAMRRAASRLEDIAGSSAARLEDVSATSTERLHELVDAVAERTEATTSRSVDLVREATEANALRTEAAVEQAVSSLLEAQTTGSREMRTAAEALTTSAQALEPTVGAALEDLRTALLARTDGDREQVEEAIAALAEASAAARDGVLSAVGRATARLAEAQAEGIGQLSAVTDDLGRLPEAIAPPVLEAVEQMQAGVRAAIQELTEASAEATRLARADLEGGVASLHRTLEQRITEAGGEVASSWSRLVSAQADSASHLEGAASSLQQVADQLEPGVRAALDDVKTTLLATSASDRDRTDRALGLLAEASEQAAGRVHQAVDGVAGSLRDAADDAATRLLGAQTEGLGALQAAVQELSGVSSQIPGVMGETRTGLLDALSEARVEIDALLTRADEAAERRVAALFGQASDAMAEQLEAHERALSARATEVVDATAGVVPGVEALVERLQREVAGVATTVLGDLQTPLAEAGRVAEAMEPALARLVEEFREALTAEVEQHMVRGEQASTTLVETAGTLTEAVESVRTDIHDQLETTRAVVVESAQTYRVAQDRGAEELRAAAAAIGEVTERLQPEVAAIVEDLRGNLLREAAAERTRADAGLGMLRESIAGTIGSLQEELAETRMSASGAATELGEATQRARAAIDEGLVGLRESLATEMEGHLAALSDRLSAAGTDTAAQTEALRDTADRMVTGVDQALAGLAEALQTSLDRTQERMGELQAQTNAAAQTLVERLEGSGTDIASELATRVDDATARVDEASIRADRAAQASSKASEDLVTIGAEVVSAVQSAAGDVTARLGASGDSFGTAVEGLQSLVDGLTGEVRTQVQLLGEVAETTATRSTGAAEAVVAQLSSSEVTVREQLAQLQDLLSRVPAAVEESLGRVTQTLAGQGKTLETRVEDLAARDQETVDRVDALVQDVTARLTEEFGSARDAIRETAALETERTTTTAAAVEAQLERLMGEVGEQVMQLTDHVREQISSRSAGDRALEERLEALGGRLTTHMEALESSVAEQAAMASDRVQREDARLAELTEQIEGSVRAVPADVARSVREIDTFVRDRLDEQRRLTGGGFAEVTSALEVIRAEIAESSRTGGSTPAAVFDSEQSPIAALIAGMEKRLLEAMRETAPRPAGQDVSDTSVEEAITRVATAAEARVDAVLRRLNGVVAKLDQVEVAAGSARLDPSVVEELRQAVAVDTGSVLETVSTRAEQVLDGVASRAEGVLGRLDEAESALRASLTDAFQHVQLDGLGRLDEATSRLIALGPRLERQTNGRLDEVVDRVVSAVADVGEALGRVEQVDQRVGETVRRALEDARRAAADTVVPTAAAEADPELARAVTDAMHQLRGRIDALQASVLEQAESMSGTRRERETALAALSDRMTELMERVDRVASRPAAPNPAPMAPPAAGTGTNTVCPDCGFVARTPPGLAAHRRTCTAGD